MTSAMAVADRAATRSNEPLVLLAIGAALLAWSGVHPADRTTWVLEVFPIVIGVPILVATARRFPLTPLLYRLILLHSVVLLVGGHYTYAKVPLGFWLEDLFGFTRNHYDRIGHFMQGLVPAMLAREVLLRKSPLVRGGWLFFLVISVCALVTVSYEFIEWWSALIGGASADAFLGTQGDPWDTQWDMFLAITGAIVAQLTLAPAHDRQLTSKSLVEGRA